MKWSLKQALASLLLAGSAIALAQVPPGEVPAAGDGPGERAEPCIPAGETVPPESGLEPCVAQEPVAQANEDQRVAEASTENGTEPAAEDAEDTDPGAPAEKEFNPRDEISEDYAVPLPSDI
jgi:hypothetical protein